MSEFKNKKTVLEVRGIGKVTSDNLTESLEKQLLEISGEYQKYFKSKKSDDKTR